MRQIVGLGLGLVAFTPGAAGAGTLVFSGFTGFAPARLMAVTDVTENALIYAAEKEPHGSDPGKGGVWTSVTSAGGTLTLNASTDGYGADDLLRCIYDDAEVQAPAPRRGGNLWPVNLDACALASGNSRTADYGPGPRPGTRATRLVLAGDNEGANTGALALSGRTDGALFGLAVEIKGAGTLQLRIRAVGVASGVTETVGSLAITADSTWRRYILRGYVAQFDCSTIQAEIRATGSGATVDACEPDFRLLDSATDFPEYQPPHGVAQTVVISNRATVSVAIYGDSRTAGYGGSEYRSELSRLLLGAPVFNGGISGETSTQVKDRFIASGAAFYRSYGVVIIEAGTNNLAYPDTVMDDIATMVSNIPHGRFLIMPAFIGSSTYWDQSNVLLKRCKSAYGSRFVDTLSTLRSGGYDIPARYRLSGDVVHLNATGHGIEALEIAKAIKRNGWLDGDIGVRDSDEDQTHPIFLQSSVAAATSATEILPIGRRHGFAIYNDSSSVMYLSFDYRVSSTNFAKKFAAGEYYEMIGGKYHGPLAAMWAAANGSARVTEIV